MDEWMLNDLLECSVCLERLDTSSKVLPCQHTFCKKCLEEIVTTHKELRCPECRVLVDIKIDDLPPNVLLMRILEGMRNAAPKKRNSGGTPGSAVAPSGNRTTNAGHHHHMSPPHQLYQQLYHPPTQPPPQQPPPSLQLQQQQHLHQLATSVSSHGSGSTFNTQSNNLSSLQQTVNPIQSHPTTQIPRFCYMPNNHILSPQLGKSEPNFPTTLATGHAVPATITLNPTTKIDSTSLTNNNQQQLFYSFPQARLITSAGGITSVQSAQIVQHCQINTVSLTPKHNSSVVSTHTNCLSNGTHSSLTQTCPHSYPGYGSISSLGIVPRSQHNTLQQIPPPSSSTTAFILDQQRSSQVGTSDSSGPIFGQQRVNSNSLLPHFKPKQTSVTCSEASTSYPNTTQNYLFLSNSRSNPSQGSIGPLISIAGASGTSANSNQMAKSVASSKVTPVFSMTNSRQHSQAPDVALSTSSSQSNVTSNLQNLAHINMAPLTSPLPGLQHQCKHGPQAGSSATATMSSSLPNNNQSTIAVQSSVSKDRQTETKDPSRSRPNSVYQYSQLADCLSLSSSSVLPSKPDGTSDAISEDNMAPLPPVRSESISQTDTDSNAQLSSVGNTAVIGAKSVGSTAVIGAKLIGTTAVTGAKPIGNTDSSVTTLPSTAANLSVPLIKGINQPCARAVYDYLSKMPGDLSFKEGDLIILRRKIDNNWYHGECRGQSGVFPLSYVQIITPLPNHIPQCKALFDFRMNNDDEEGCLTFNKGDVVTVIRRVDENWAEGRLGERIGIFPLAFVELNNVARALMKLSINSQPGPSRLAPPTPTTVDDSTTPLIPTNHSPNVSTTAASHHATTGGGTTTTTTTSHHTAVASDGSTSTTLTSPSSSSTSSTSSSSSSTTPPTSSSASSPSSPGGGHPPPPLPTHPHPVQSVKRHSFTVLQQQQQQQNLQNHQNQQHSLQPPDQQLHQHNNRHSAEILTSSEQTSSNSHGPHSLAVMTSSSSNSSANTPVHSSGTADTSALIRSGSQRRHHQRSASADAHHASATPPPSALLAPQHASLQLPATYVALYPYKPQKSDELELKRGNVYTVTERCQDGWFKGTNKHQKCGVFPGNYVAPSKSLPAVQAQLRGIGRIAIVGTTARNGSTAPAAPSPEPRTYFRFSGGGQNAHNARLLAAPAFGNVVGGGSSNPPELPPRSVSPGTISSSWHSGDGSTPTRAHNMSASVGSSHHDNSNSVGRNSPITVTSSPPNVTVTSSKSSEKVKEKKERTSGGGIMRIFSMKKSPPPPTTYSMDNPVFDDGTTSTATTTPATTTTTTTTAQPQSPPQQPAQLTPVHVRSGSCPSQLLQVTPSGDHSRSSPSHHHHHHHHHRLFSPSSSQRLKHKERPTVNGAHFSSPSRAGDSSLPAPPQHHRKSNSLDASATLGGGSSTSASEQVARSKPASKQLVPVVRERFRCIVPYPPNSEYELELQVGDLIYVHRKREDGWYKGTQQRTGKTGLFPASFVESF